MEYVEHRARKVSVIDQSEKILFHNEPSPRHIHNVGSFRQARQGVAIEQASRLSSQRQEADENPAILEKGM